MSRSLFTSLEALTAVRRLFAGSHECMVHRRVWWRLASFVLLMLGTPVSALGESRPTNLSAALADGKVTLAWEAPTADAGSITGFPILRRLGTDAFGEFTAIDTAAASASLYFDRDVAPGERHTYRIKALRGTVSSEASDDARVDVPMLPAAPESLTATPGDRRLILTWRDPEDDAIERYQWRARSHINPQFGVWRDIDGSDSTTKTYSVATGLNGFWLEFEVRARNAAGSGAASVGRTLVGPPPSGFAATGGDRSVALTWNSVPVVTEFVYEIRHGEGASPTEWTTTDLEPASGPDGPAYTVPGLTNGTACRFEVRAKIVVDGHAFYGASSGATATPVPDAPRGLDGAAGDGKVVLSWEDPGPGAATGYQVRYAESGMDLPSWSGDGNVETIDANTTHTVRDLTNGTTYTFEVRAQAGTVYSEASGVTAMLPARPAAPAAPEGLRVVAVGEDFAILAWDDPENSAITGYQIHFLDSGGGSAPWRDIIDSGAGTTRHRVQPLTSRVTWTISVRAKHGEAAGAAASVDVAVGLPAAPRNLQVKWGDGEAPLTWWRPYQPWKVTGYQISYGASAAYSPDWRAITPSDANTTSHTVTGLTNGTRYTIELRAYKDAGPFIVAGDSVRVTAVTGRPPPAPARFSASAGDGEVTLTWADPADEAVSAYQISHGRSDAYEPSWGDIEGSGRGTTEHTVGDLTNGIAYTFDVRAKRGSVAGASSRATATPKAVPPAPVGLTATAGARQVTLSWDDPADDSIDKYQVRVQNASSGSSGWRDIAESGPRTVQHTRGRLTSGIEHTFWLRAFNASGAGDSSSVRATPVPGAPDGLQAAPGDGVVALVWQDPGDGGITRYHVRHRRGRVTDAAAWNNYEWVEIDGSGSSTTRHEVENLTNGIEYTFQVRAQAGAVYGAPSDVRGTPQAAPSAPESLEAMARDRQVVLSWADPNNAAITGYQVRYEESGTDLPAWSAAHDVASSDTTTTHPVRDLTNGTAYVFEVRAKAGVVYGAASSVTATPRPLPWPTNLTGRIDNGAVVLTWDAPEAAENDQVTGYQVLRRASGQDALGAFTPLADVLPPPVARHLSRPRRTSTRTSWQISSTCTA